MPSVGSYEAKTHLPALIKRAERGERITITRHGKPVALLIPFSEVEAQDRSAAVDRLRVFRMGRALGRGSPSVISWTRAGDSGRWISWWTPP